MVNNTPATFNVNFSEDENLRVVFAEEDEEINSNFEETTFTTTTNYNELTNKPVLNGVIIQGEKTALDYNIVEDKKFVYTQEIPSVEWIVTHNLNKYPAVMVVDSALTEVIGDIDYIDLNTVRLTFSAGFSGKAFFN